MEIDFLKLDKRKEKKKEPETKEIKWSNIEKEPETDAGQGKDEGKPAGGLKKVFGFLKSKFRRRQLISPDLASKIDKKSVLSARKEVLKDIKQEKKELKKEGGWFKPAEKKPKLEKKEERREDKKYEDKEVRGGKESPVEIKAARENFLKKAIARVRAGIFGKKGEPGEKKDSGRELSRVPETNLIRDDLVIFIDWKKNIIMLLVFAGLSVGLIGGTYWGMHKWGKDREASSREMEEEFKKLDEEIKGAEIEVKEILVFKNRLSLASELLGRHIYWTNFFKFLEDNILTDIYFNANGFSGNTNGQYSFGVAGKDFGSIEAQARRLLANKYVTGVNTGQAQISQTADGQIGSVGFNIELSLDKSIFLEPEEK